MGLLRGDRGERSLVRWSVAPLVRWSGCPLGQEARLLKEDLNGAPGSPLTSLPLRWYIEHKTIKHKKDDLATDPYVKTGPSTNLDTPDGCRHTLNYVWLLLARGRGRIK